MTWSAVKCITVIINSATTTYFLTLPNYNPLAQTFTHKHSSVLSLQCIIINSATTTYFLTLTNYNPLTQTFTHKHSSILSLPHPSRIPISCLRACLLIVCLTSSSYVNTDLLLVLARIWSRTCFIMGGKKSFCANFSYLSSNSCGNLLPFASTQTPNTVPRCITSTTSRSRWEHGPTTRPSRRHRQHHHTHRRHLSNYRSCPPWCNRPPSISCIIPYITGISVSSTNSAPIVIFTGMTLTLVLWPWLTFRSDLWFILWPLWGFLFVLFLSCLLLVFFFLSFLPAKLMHLTMAT